MGTQRQGSLSPGTEHRRGLMICNSYSRLGSVLYLIRITSQAQRTRESSSSRFPPTVRVLNVISQQQPMPMFELSTTRDYHSTLIMPVYAVVRCTIFRCTTRIDSRPRACQCSEKPSGLLRLEDLPYLKTLE